MSNKKIALIFDMDGVVVDNIPYHRQIWRLFFIAHGKKFTKNYFDNQVNGKRAAEIYKNLFNNSVADKQALAMDVKREASYRKLYAPHIRPLSGLKKFLAAAKKAKIPMALATSAPKENVNFVLGKTGLRKFFDCIVDAGGVKNGKPAPDMFLKAAKKLGVKPQNCIVFEDAILGVQAARRAKTRLVAVTTTYKKNQLAPADWFIKDFRKFKLPQLFRE